MLLTIQDQSIPINLESKLVNTSSNTNQLPTLTFTSTSTSPYIHIHVHIHINIYIHFLIHLLPYTSMSPYMSPYIHIPITSMSPLCPWTTGKCISCPSMYVHTTSFLILLITIKFWEI